ncbi:uncharacterized protein LOC124154365 isoform X2 [Ischnura elegans]|uniref:uncharacterized protein LOC124154365 isoform X2 n=1 Tax=Ischnura elegans TaxID=197161 RepID=UPI001ED88A46|nr:uncharacterized protein LOC124154365 isoform X2 [Ischnura elegans]
MKTSCHLLIVIGAVMVFSTHILCSTNDPSGNTCEVSLDCQNQVQERTRIFRSCFDHDFSDEEVNVTMSMYNQTKCLYCKHLCRKQSEVLRCIRESEGLFISLSNKSAQMVPFVRELVELSLQTLCENDAELITAFLDEDQGDCLTSSWYECKPHFEGAHDFTRIAYCDLVNPENDPYTKQFICRKYLDFLTCAEKVTEKCSSEMKNSTQILINKWRNTEQCSKYL